MSSPKAPIVVKHVAELRAAVSAARAQGRTVGFVPTMGALHAGHVSLMRAAAADGHYVVASIYVNPTQFGPNEDLAAYPRTLDADLEACRAAGVNLVFSPEDRELYPPGEQTRVRPGKLAEALCGPFRPGHFDGVCTVVAKLFNLVQPDVAYFGQKDAQQAIIIRRMVIDLCFPVCIKVMPIFREADGLAMSSRNAYLSSEERRRATCLIRALERGRDLITGGCRRPSEIERAMLEKVTELGGPDARVDYLSAVDAETLETVDPLPARTLLAGAVRIGRTRLIDNLVVETGPGLTTG